MVTPMRPESPTLPEVSAPATPDLVVSSIRTLRLESDPTYLWVEVRTAGEASGVGETVLGPEAVEAYIHDSVAPYLLGRDALAIEGHAQSLRGYLGYDGSGVETRGSSAIDMALWDLFGQVTGLPLYQLLGGRVRDAMRVYNTCAGYDFGRNVTLLGAGVVAAGLDGDRAKGPYDDLAAAIERPDELAQDLLAEGYSAMKIWPFDSAALSEDGRSISRTSLRAALEPLRKIRAAVGSRMDILIDFHGLWQWPAILTIVEALEEYGPLWLEDPMRWDSADQLARLAASTRLPVALSESMASIVRYREMMERHAVGVVIVDVSWCGGISEARKIASLAATHQLPVTVHECTGPLALAAASHLAVHLPNAMLQEVVRARIHGWYQEIVEGLPVPTDGLLSPSEAPGLGVRFRPGLWERSDAHVQESSAADARW
jgi:L-alanine-DL-glutamate epimerase-like enolase superfamily enzyme